MSHSLKMGLIGGGPGAFIGDVHVKAARLDGGVDLVAGVFSRDSAKSRQAGRSYGLADERIYPDIAGMIAAEQALPEDERIDFVAIATPNDSHFPIARAFVEAGFHVMCEKPMTRSTGEARQLHELVNRSAVVFALMHNYTGYPMVKLARDMIRAGDLGALRKIVVQYPQGWLSTALEQTGQKQAEWRTDPARSGAAGCLGDIGTHAANLAEYITGLQITHVCAEVTTFVPGRRLDDDVSCLLRFGPDVRGILHASQIAAGEENALRIAIHGEQASLSWCQQQPDVLMLTPLDSPPQIWKRGNPWVGQKSPAADRATRLPAGHPEGYLEAFAAVYHNFCDTLRARKHGRHPEALVQDFPGIEEGLRGMRFIETVLKSAHSEVKWIEF